VSRRDVKAVIFESENFNFWKFSYVVHRVFKRQFQGLQIGILNHTVTVKITELRDVTVKIVKIKLCNQQLS